VRMLGAIPDEEEIVVASNHGEPVVGTETMSGQAYVNICRRILGEKVPLMSLEKNLSFRTRLSSFLKKNKA
ncbi:MAG: septum site-determining protein MinD, partial [Lachnospiraceae bacterium]|nr:septum site-determining protein MinD [Lachnospiraceae bacterium]